MSDDLQKQINELEAKHRKLLFWFLNLEKQNLETFGANLSVLKALEEQNRLLRIAKDEEN